MLNISVTEAWIVNHAGTDTEIFCYGTNNLFIFYLSKIIFYQRPAGKEDKKKTKSPKTCNKVFFDRNTTPLKDD